MLWAHQAEEVDRLLARPHHGLFWRPGVGKTAPLIVAGQRVGGRQLWITLASLRFQAAREIRRWRRDRPRMQVILEGTDVVNKDAQVVIVSFEHARLPAIWKQLFKLHWDVLTIDEAHRLSSPGASTTKAIYGARVTSKGALIRSADRVWIGTGTPWVNWPSELWTHFSRLWPELVADCVNEDGDPTHKAWCDRFCQVRRTDYGRQIVGGKEPKEIRRRLLQAGTILRLEDVYDMPDLIVDSEAIEGDEIDLSQLDEQTVFEVQRALAGAAEGEWTLEGIDVLGSPVSTLRRLIANAKADAVAARVAEEIEGGEDRILVFGCHVEALRRAAERIGQRRISWGLILGGSPQAQRNEYQRQFLAGEIKVLVGNVQAMGTGLNLQAARRAVFLDASWSPGQNAQAIGRIYRAGQTRSCHVTFFGLQGSVDDDVARVLARKARFLRKTEK